MSNYVQRTSGADAANRDAEDFYPTPTVAVESLLGVEKFTSKIWEPACGDGAISKVLVAAGYDVCSTDLYNRGYGSTGPEGDFLKMNVRGVENIVTNPPFKLTQQFIEHALKCTTHKVAMLGRASWLEGRKRYETLFAGHSPLARVWIFSSRLHFHRSGDASKAGSSGMVAFAWYVWDHKHKGPVTLDWIPPFKRQK